MTAVVVAEAVAIGLLTILVAGLLRTQARIVAVLRHGTPDTTARHHGTPETVRPAVRQAGPTNSGRRREREAPEISGVDLDGQPMQVGTEERRVLAFLTSGCTSCQWWWAQLREIRSAVLPGVVAVTPDPGTDAPEDVRPLVGDGLSVIMSSATWETYQVTAGSTFVIVEHGRVVASGSAASWDELMALLGEVELSEPGH